MSGRGARRSRERKGRREIPAEIERYILAQRPRQRPLLRLLRKLIKEVLPSVSEELRWGRPCYLVGPGKVAYLQAAVDHVSLGIFQGGEFEDPKGLLEGAGQDQRHVKVRMASDIKRRDFTVLLRQAAARATEAPAVRLEPRSLS
jgi:hypothetical protein